MISYIYKTRSGTGVAGGWIGGVLAGRPRQGQCNHTAKDDTSLHQEVEEEIQGRVWMRGQQIVKGGAVRRKGEDSLDSQLGRW